MSARVPISTSLPRGIDSLELAGQRAVRVRSRKVALDLVAAADVLAVALGICVPALIYAHTSGLPIQPVSIAQAGLIAALFAHLCLRSCQCYEPNQIHRLPVRPFEVGTALFIALLASLGLGVPFETYDHNIAIWYALWGASSYVLLVIQRHLFSKVLREMALSGHFDQRICVYGAGPIAQRVHDYLENGSVGLSFVGVFDDRVRSGRSASEGIGVSGGIEDLIEAGRRGEVDQIVIALPQTADRRIAEIARQLEQLPVSLHVVTHMASDLVDPASTHRVSALGPVGMLDVKPHPLADWSPIIKRAEDLLISTVLLVLLLPLLAVIAILVRLDSPGPILFRQHRRGFNLAIFEMLKFRTMHVLEDDANVTQAVPNDQRITRIGQWLRRTSLDELPQLWNVLRGDMSIVGPRPHAIAHDDAWQRQLARYANRNQVKPGITGLAQISGARGRIGDETDLRRRVDGDLEYIANWSLMLDLKIMVRTLFAIIDGRNAY